MDAVVDYYRRVAPFYDREMAHRGDEEFWCRLGQAASGQRVLEVGCGTGRVARLLAEDGARVVGFDLSPEMLERANGFPRVLADMRACPFRGGAFDLVVAADDPFSHLTDDRDRRRALAELARLLAPNGRLVVDALWFPPAERARLARGRRAHRRVPDGDGTLVVEELWRARPGSACCAASYRYARDGREVARASFVARAWRTGELETQLAALGLTVERRSGGYDGEPWDERTSQHLVVEVRKP